jgi:N6-adenosine-specific RNA methylase IME4
VQQVATTTPTVESWAGRISAAWNQTREGIIEVGRLITDAKAALPHGEFSMMIERELPFSPQTARKLMGISNDKRLTNHAHVRVLPPAWGTLAEITKLDDGQFSRAVAEGIINPDMKRVDITHFIKAERRHKRHKEIVGGSKTEVGIPGQYHLISADPPWEFKTYSEKGKDLAPDQHYPTLSDDEIAAYRIGDVWIGDCAARDSVLFMWCTPANMLRALGVLSQWGFEYRSHLVWVKDRAGTGFYSRQQHEPLLIGVKGKPPSPIYVPPSVIEAPRGRHSEKPDVFRETLEKMYPHWGRKHRVELFARKPLPEWSVSGFEAS